MKSHAYPLHYNFTLFSSAGSTNYVIWDIMYSINVKALRSQQKYFYSVGNFFFILYYLNFILFCPFMISARVTNPGLLPSPTIISAAAI